VGHVGDVVHGHERHPAANPHDKARDGRVGLLSVPTRDDVDQRPDLLTGLVEYRSVGHAGQGDEVVAQRTRGQQTLLALAPGSP
jgi:hypothetical protein